MPIYDYICTNGHRTEVIHGVHAEGPTICPHCGGPLRRAVSAPTIHFRGSGWAKKDRSTTSKPATKAAAGEPAAGGTVEEGTKSEGSTRSDGSTKSDGSAKSEGSAGPDKKA